VFLVAEMTFVFSRVDYCDMCFVYGFYDGNALAVVEEYQRSKDSDYAQRMDLCHWIKAHSKLLSVILFSDEASFTRDGVNNVQNVHTWSHNNPHETSIMKFQKRFSVNVWCGALGNRLIGPFVFHNNLTGRTCEAYETKVDSREALRDRIFAAAEHIRNHPGNIASATQSLLMITSVRASHVSCIVNGTLKTTITCLQVFL
jgi:hypothetical protein